MTMTVMYIYTGFNQQLFVLNSKTA